MITAVAINIITSCMPDIRHFTRIISLNPNPERKVLLLSVFYRYYLYLTELFKDTQLINSKPEI